MSYEADQIQSLCIALRDLQKDGLVSELRLLRKAIEEQNTELQEQIKLEKQIKSLFGWLFELFAF